MLKKFLFCLLLMLLAFPAFSQEFIDGDVLVVLKPEEGEGNFSASSFAAASGSELKTIYASLSDVSGSFYALLHSDSKSADEFSRELLKDPRVIAASPNYIIHAAVLPDDSYIDYCWGLDYINAPEAWEISRGSSSVYVAVIDSGIDETNPDLTANVALEYGLNTIDSTKTATDDNGHGTHVAGTIGAVGNNGIGISGVNWDVKLIAVKALDNRGSGSFANVMDGLDYVVSLIEQGVNIKAVNLSLETYIPYKPTHDNLVTFPMWRAFKALDELNKAVIVVAAGNQNAVVGEATTRTKRASDGSVIYRPGYYVYPPSFKGLYNMISVSAIAQNGSLASFTNTNADISAPGVGIVSTWLQSSRGYIQEDGVSLNTIQGTSMAAPHVAGAAALLASIMSDRTAYQLKQALLRGGESSSASINASASGIMDLRASIDYQQANRNSIPKESSEWAEYNDYQDYDAQNPDYSQDQDYGSGSGDCNNFLLNVLAMLLILPLARKLMN